jgi:hypothetical protein
MPEEAIWGGKMKTMLLLRDWARALLRKHPVEAGWLLSGVGYGPRYDDARAFPVQDIREVSFEAF